MIVVPWEPMGGLEGERPRDAGFHGGNRTGASAGVAQEHPRAGPVDVFVCREAHESALNPLNDPGVPRLDIGVAVLDATLFSDDPIHHAVAEIDDLLGVVVVVIPGRPILLDE